LGSCDVNTDFLNNKAQNLREVVGIGLVYVGDTLGRAKIALTFGFVNIFEMALFLLVCFCGFHVKASANKF
jgi:hypothetical protein